MKQDSRELDARAVAGLRRVIQLAREHWDALGKPYPEHLQAAIDQVEARDREKKES